MNVVTACYKTTELHFLCDKSVNSREKQINIIFYLNSFHKPVITSNL